MIFAEGAITNGSALIKFKKGAFASEKPIRPIFMKYEWGTFNPCYTMDLLSNLIMHMCFISYKCTVHVMPDFIPNEDLFQNNEE
jgi:hypothetical protein